jgi:hypothetical protein
MDETKCTALAPLASSRPTTVVRDVADARAFYMSNGISAGRLDDQDSFNEADSEFCFRVRRGELDAWLDATKIMRRHFWRVRCHSGEPRYDLPYWPDSPDHRSRGYDVKSLDNVYRLYDLWSRVA